MKILLYRGHSIISWLIKKQTRSIYSHAAVLMNDGSVIEAWQSVGVRRTSSPFDGHSPHTPIDVYKIDDYYNAEKIEKFLVAQLGKKYDYRAVIRFVSRVKAPDNDKWFCSELTHAAFVKGGLELLHGNSAIMSPRDISLSPIIKFEKTIEE